MEIPLSIKVCSECWSLRLQGFGEHRAGGRAGLTVHHDSTVTSQSQRCQLLTGVELAQASDTAVPLPPSSTDLFSTIKEYRTQIDSGVENILLLSPPSSLNL